MLTPDEKKFLEFWKLNRQKEKNIFRQLKTGLPLGLLLGIAILVNFSTGWYKRANMVAYSQSTPLVLLVAIAIIAIFCAVFYKKHKWDMNEQHYKELLAKNDTADSDDPMQHQTTIKSQSVNKK